MRTKSLKVYPRDLDRLRALCRPGQTPAGALAELLDAVESLAAPQDQPGSRRDNGVLVVPLSAEKEPTR